MASEAHHTGVQDGYAACTCGWRSLRVFGDPGPLATWHRLAIGETIDNPYLRAFLAPIADAEVAARGAHGSEYLGVYTWRFRVRCCVGG